MEIADKVVGWVVTAIGFLGTLIAGAVKMARLDDRVGRLEKDMAQVATREEQDRATIEEIRRSMAGLAADHRAHGDRLTGIEARLVQLDCRLDGLPARIADAIRNDSR